MSKKIVILFPALVLLVVLASLTVPADTVPLWYTQGDSLKATITKTYMVFGNLTFNRDGTITTLKGLAAGTYSNQYRLSNTANDVSGDSAAFTSGIFGRTKIGTNGSVIDSIKTQGGTPDTILIYIGGKVAKLQLN